MDFVGRQPELAALGSLLGQVGGDIGSERPGRCLVVRGRRRIGKSALVEEFIRRAGVPHVFFTAEISAAAAAPLGEFVNAVRESDLPEADVFAEATPGNWTAALRQLGGILPEDRPSIVVIDELPYLIDAAGEF